MQRNFIINLGLLILLNLLVKPFYILGIDTGVLEAVGQREYGTYFALLNLSYILNIVLDMGLVNLTTGTISRHRQLITKHFSGIVALRLLLALCYIILCLVVALVLGYGKSDISLLIPLCLNQVLVGFILYLRSNLSALQLYRVDSLISVADRVLLILICSPILWGGLSDVEMTIELFIYLQTGAYAITLVMAYILLRPYLIKPGINLNMAFNMVILKKSLPYALLVLLMSFYYRTDGLMIERMLEDGAYESGIYAQAYRFFEAANMLAYLFAGLLFPMFSSILNNKKEMTDLLVLSTRIITVIAAVAGIACVEFSTEIMEMRFSSGIEESSAAFRYLMAGFIPVCIAIIFGSLLTANGNLRELNYLALAGAILNIGLNLFFIPKMKSEGAALASMITQYCMALTQIWLVKKLTGIWPGTQVTIRLLTFIALLTVTPLFLKSAFGDVRIQIILYILLSVVLIYAMKLFSFKNIIHYLAPVRAFRNQND